MRGAEHGRLGFQPMPEEMFHHYSGFMRTLAQNDKEAMLNINNATTWLNTKIEQAKIDLLASKLRVTAAFNTAVCNIFNLVSDEVKAQIRKARRDTDSGIEGAYLDELKRLNRIACDRLYESMVESY